MQVFRVDARPAAMRASYDFSNARQWSKCKDASFGLGDRISTKERIESILKSGFGANYELEYGSHRHYEVSLAPGTDMKTLHNYIIGKCPDFDCRFCPAGSILAAFKKAEIARLVVVRDAGVRITGNMGVHVPGLLQ